MKYQLFHPNGPRDQVASAGTTVLQAYGQHVLDSDDTETARAKIEKEIRRLPTAQWIWENQSEDNPLGDLRVWQHLPGTFSFYFSQSPVHANNAPAVRNHPRTGQPAFFNNIVSRYLNAKKSGTLNPPHKNEEGKYQPPAFVRHALEVR